MDDLYDVLGVDRGASDAEIASAYRSLALKYHPDRAGSDPAAAKKFKEVTKAFEVLGDKDKRSQYDNGGRHSFNIDPFSVFDHIFGESPFQGSTIDVETVCTLTLEEAYKGCEKKIIVPIMEQCSKCDGSGATEWKTCDLCNGQGRTVHLQGAFHIAVTCSKCRGNRKTPSQICTDCQGNGEYSSGDRELTVDFPPGVDEGFALRIDNVLCRVKMLDHAIFKRNRQDLHYELVLTIPQLYLGFNLTIPHVSGKDCVVKLPIKSKPGTIVRLEKMGMPGFRGQFGDLFVHIDMKWFDEPCDEFDAMMRKFGEKNEIC